jgi:hypothetical protein
MGSQLRSQGSNVDLQSLHAAGADCGGDHADDWLAYRPGRRLPTGGTIYDRVRRLHVALQRRVTVDDILAEDRAEARAEQLRLRAEDADRVRRRIAATPPTLPPGPAPVPAYPSGTPGTRVRATRRTSKGLARNRCLVPKPPPAPGQVLSRRQGQRAVATMTAGKDRHFSTRREIALARLLCRIIPRLAQQVRA